ncbi:MAG: CHAT domain-containing protein, partial [Chloroflexi bacterium]|nr:CHAT domain-containing protein [Chloroflexota bacterium]
MSRLKSHSRERKDRTAEQDMAEYRNFDLEAFDYDHKDGVETFRVRVLDSPAGEQRRQQAEEVRLPADLRKRLRQLERRKLSLAEIIALGETLGALLFPPCARDLLKGSVVATRQAGQRLRIRLRLHDYALASLPWEYVYPPSPDTPAEQKDRMGFLALDPHVSLVRYEPLGQAPGSLDPVGAAPLRLVALLADPREPGFDPLDLEKEQQTIAEALRDVPRLKAEFYPQATVTALSDALVHPAHIFHFAGHGQFTRGPGEAYGSVEGEGSILLHGEGGIAEPFPAEKLALCLRGRGIRLAVLGVCESGRRDAANAWSGIAPALTRAGIPAVLAQQLKIRDTSAVHFHRAFYRTLAAGGSVDQAVTDGRLAIVNHSADDERDWGVPVLYLCLDTPDAVLFLRPGDAETRVEAAPVVLSTYHHPPTARHPLFGRQGQLDGVTAALRAGQTVLLYGMGGIGKTALAAAVAERLLKERACQDGLLWVSDVGKAPLTALCDAVARHLKDEDIPRLPAAAKPDATCALLQGRDLLLVLDDLAAPEVAQAFLRGCQPRGRPLLATSRHWQRGFDRDERVDKLERPDATALFRHLAGQPTADGLVEAVCGVLEDHPLALVIAAGRLRGEALPLARLHERLANEKERLKALKLGEGKDVNVWASLRLSYQDLDE